jgi:hypothetical protein
LAKNQSQIGHRFLPINERSEAIISKAPAELEGKTALMYKSAMKTRISGWDRKPLSICGRGDRVVPAEGIEWTCTNWTNITCVDLMKSKGKHEYHPLFIVNLTIGMGVRWEVAGGARE